MALQGLAQKQGTPYLGTTLYPGGNWSPHRTRQGPKSGSRQTIGYPYMIYLRHFCDGHFFSARQSPFPLSRSSDSAIHRHVLRRLSRSDKCRGCAPSLHYHPPLWLQQQNRRARTTRGDFNYNSILDDSIQKAAITVTLATTLAQTRAQRRHQRSRQQLQQRQPHIRSRRP